jgi:hypothetical protein
VERMKDALVFRSEREVCSEAVSGRQAVSEVVVFVVIERSLRETESLLDN